MVEWRCPKCLTKYTGCWAQSKSQCPTCLIFANLFTIIEQVAGYTLTNEQFTRIFNEKYWKDIKIKKIEEE